MLFSFSAIPSSNCRLFTLAYFHHTMDAWPNVAASYLALHKAHFGFAIHSQLNTCLWHATAKWATQWLNHFSTPSRIKTALFKSLTTSRPRMHHLPSKVGLMPLYWLLFWFHCFNCCSNIISRPMLCRFHRMYISV